MKSLLLIPILIINLTGCVGYSFSRNSDVVITQNMVWMAKLHVSDSDLKPNRIPDKINPDGSEMFVLQDDRKWCGLTIYVIIPIPLWVPVCHDRVEATYKNGKLIQVAHQWPFTSGFACGPYVGFSAGPQSFCQ